MDIRDALAIAYLSLAGFSTVLSIVARVFLMLAVGEDMKAKGLRARGVWMVITFFVPYCAIVYVIVRKWLPTEGTQYCERCHTTVAPGAVQCPVCGSGRLTPAVAASGQPKKKIKAFAVTGAVLYAVCAVLLLISTIIGIATAADYLEDVLTDIPQYYEEFENGDSDEFFDDFEEYPYNEDDFEDFFENYEEYGYGDMPFDFNDNQN